MTSITPANLVLAEYAPEEGENTFPIEPHKHPVYHKKLGGKIDINIYFQENHQVQYAEVEIASGKTSLIWGLEDPISLEEVEEFACLLYLVNQDSSDKSKENSLYEQGRKIVEQLQQLATHFRAMVISSHSRQLL